MAIGYRGASPRFREGSTVILLSVMAVQMLSGNVVALSSRVVCQYFDGLALLRSNFQAHFSFLGLNAHLARLSVSQALYIHTAQLST